MHIMAKTFKISVVPGYGIVTSCKEERQYFSDNAHLSAQSNS